MPNIIRIKRSTGSTAPSTLKNAELAYAEGNNTLYIGTGISSGDTAANVVKIGGSGAFLTFDTNQTPTGTKTFSTSTFKLTGGSSGQFLKTDGSGNVSWDTTSTSAYNSILGDVGGTITATGATSLKITGGIAAVTVTVSEGVQDTASISVASASTTAAGIVQLESATNSTSQTTAATSKAVKDAYDLADAALPKAGGTMTGFITLHADPSSDMHAATKKYVDGVATGLDVKPSVRAATTAALPGGAGTYSNGSSGVGATLTGGSSAALGTIDDISDLAVGQRILVKNQSNQAHNGIYTITNLGNGVTQGFILTRATDSDTNAEVTAGLFVFVEEGTRNGDNGFVLSTNGSITVGTTNLEFTQFSGAGKITAGTGLTKDGDTLSVSTVPAANGGTGLTSYAVGDILYASGTTTLAKLTAAATGNALISGGASTAPAWGKIGLTTHVSGTLPVTNGGTGATTLTGLVKGNGTSAFTAATAGTDYVVAGTETVGKVVFKTPDSVGSFSSSAASLRLPPSTLIANSYTNAESGDIWNNNGNALQFVSSSGTKTIAFTDSNITGNAANVTGVVAVANGGTGVSSFTTDRLIMGKGSGNLVAAVPGTDYVLPGTTTVGKVIFANATTSIASVNLGAGTADPSSPVNGDFWNNAGTLKLYYGSTKTLLLDDSTLDGGSFS